MPGWTNDLKDDSDDGEEDAGEAPETFEAAVEAGDLSALGEVEVATAVEDIDDEDLLRDAKEAAEDANVQAAIDSRLTAVEVSTAAEGFDDAPPMSESGGETSESEGNPGQNGTEPSESAERPQMTSALDARQETSNENETAHSGAQAVQSDGGPPTPSSAISVDEAADRDRRWKLLVWGPPKLFKTHFAFTMPEPIAFLDLEGKADDLAPKFRGKEVQIWQVDEMTAEPDTKFRRAKKALDEALEWLDWWREERDETGTIVVDSMTLMWEWAQTHHKLENHPLKDPEDIELSANLGSSQESDWAVVKEYHNGEFRERITDSPYHFLWTAMQRQDFERTLDDDEGGNQQFYEPRGETNNAYKADTVIRARRDESRGKVGDVVGSNFTDNLVVGLYKPTFPKVREAIETIQQAEAGELEATRGELADEVGAEAIIDYDPQVYVQQ